MPTYAEIIQYLVDHPKHTRHLCRQTGIDFERFYAAISQKGFAEQAQSDLDGHQ